MRVQYAKDSEVKNTVYTAFVAELLNTWWLVTAGHCLNDLKEAEKAGWTVRVELLDNISKEAKHLMPLPLGYQENLTFTLYKEGLWDYSLIQLDQNHVANMTVNGVEAMSAAAISELPEDLDIYFLLGVPAESVADDHTKIGIASLPLAPLSEKPKWALNDPDSYRFYGQLSEGNAVASGKGMSGGPIIALRNGDDGLKYWVVGIQSEWEKGSRVVAACYIHPFFEAAENLVRKHLVRDE